jgi:hypothetical protein
VNEYAIFHDGLGNSSTRRRIGARTAGAIAAGTLLSLTTGLSAAQTKIPYGSRAGMSATVLSMEGLDTEHAVIRVEHTRQDAEDYSISYVGALTPECVQRTLATVSVADRVTADCRSGEFTDLHGDRYRFEGPARGVDRKEIRAKYTLRHLPSGEIADGSSASGYRTSMMVLRALCPQSAPTDD